MKLSHSLPKSNPNPPTQTFIQPKPRSRKSPVKSQALNSGINSRLKVITNPTPQDIENAIQDHELTETPIFTQFCALSLLQAGLPINRVAQLSNLSIPTVQKINENQDLKDLLGNKVLLIKKAIPAMMYQTSFRAMARITDAQLDKINALQKGILAKLLVEGARLMEGQSTVNVSLRDLVPEIQAKMEKYAETLDRVKDMIKQKDGSYAPSEENV